MEDKTKPTPDNAPIPVLRVGERISVPSGSSVLLGVDTLMKGKRLLRAGFAGRVRMNNSDVLILLRPNETNKHYVSSCMYTGTYPGYRRDDGFIVCYCGFWAEGGRVASVLAEMTMELESRDSGGPIQGLMMRGTASVHHQPGNQQYGSISAGFHDVVMKNSIMTLQLLATGGAGFAGEFWVEAVI
jgi:hypothetical protein